MHWPTAAFTLAHPTHDMARQSREAALPASWLHQASGVCCQLCWEVVQSGNTPKVWRLSPVIY